MNRLHALPLLFCAALGVTACGGGSSDATSTPTPAPAPTPSPATPPPLSGGWVAVDQKIAAAFAGSGVQGMTVAVFDRSDVKVFEKSYGNFSPTQRVAVASASKLVAGTVIFRLIGQGFLSLDSTTAQVLGWSGARGAISLRHLLSFTSGLVPEPACINNPFITLAACVDQVRDDPAALVATPGTRFDYGSTHLHVAARMAEVATGKSWNTLYAEQLRTPLGISAESTFYTLPDQRIGTLHPRVAGGLTASLDEYARILAISFHRGAYQGVTYAPASLFDQQVIAPYPAATIGLSPFASLGLDFRYGLAAWLECSTPATGCSAMSSPGAFGWTPWLDRQAGYYAVIAMLQTNASGSGVVAFSVSLAQSLKPDIVRALAPP
jgi:CubicO group peptidase (beta-lactamase class C family)